MNNDLIRVALQGDDSSLHDLFEQSGMVEIVESAPEVLVWHLDDDADALPDAMRLALADAGGPAVVAVTERHPSPWFQEALALGVDDVIVLPQSPESLGLVAAKAKAMRGRRLALTAGQVAVKARREAHIVTVFSTKGGSGKTVIATNLAVCFARAGKRTLLVDFDLHSGDDALVLGLSPRWTVLDLVQSPGDLDAEKLAGFVTRHSSGVDLLPAPTRPDEGSSSRSSGWSRCCRSPGRATTWSSSTRRPSSRRPSCSASTTPTRCSWSAPPTCPRSRA